MNDVEEYLFDLRGYLHIPAMLTPHEVDRLFTAARELADHALACRETAPRFRSIQTPNDVWQDPEYGYFAMGDVSPGDRMTVDDFWLFDSTFDVLIGHERTMRYIRRIIQGPIAINNSLFLVRCPGNFFDAHCGYPDGRTPKLHYDVLDGRISCTMMRIVYFLHDLGPDDGVMAFVPGSHRNMIAMPLKNVTIDDEPGMIGVPVKAGDAIMFTEACRHGGLTNRSERTRHTLHVGYGPRFLKSQNIATMGEDMNVTDALLARLTDKQRELLVPPRRYRIDQGPS